MKRIGVIGQGYVGLPLALAAAESGYQVLGFDLNSKLVDSLNSGQSHIEDIPNHYLQKLVNSDRYRASHDPTELNFLDVAVIAVPTPLNQERNPDLGAVEAAAKLLGKNLKQPTLIINESTSYPGTLRKIIAPIVNDLAPSDVQHHFAISPERVDPGNKSWGLGETPRLFAGLTPTAHAMTEEFYSSFCKNLVSVSSPEVAEAAKLFENTFRQVNIALVNEFAQITHALGIPVNEILNAASTKPYGFMKFTPGLGVGGHCIPVDPTYLSFIADSVGVESRFIKIANEVNLKMPLAIIRMIEKEIGHSLAKKKVVICGLGYKNNISDIRESPSLILRDHLILIGAQTYWHDPLVSNLGDEKSAGLSESEYDVAIIAVQQDGFDYNQIKKSASFVFDCTGTVPFAKSI